MMPKIHHTHSRTGLVGTLSRECLKRGEKDIRNTQLARQMKSLRPGDLIYVEWFDASSGPAILPGDLEIDVLVQSWGIYLGVFGRRSRLIVIAQNTFQFTDTLFDMDYTAIPVSWAVKVQVVAERFLPADIAQNLINSFISGKRRTAMQKMVQRRCINSERLHQTGLNS